MMHRLKSLLIRRPGLCFALAFTAFAACQTADTGGGAASQSTSGGGPAASKPPVQSRPTTAPGAPAASTQPSTPAASAEPSSPVSKAVAAAGYERRWEERKFEPMMSGSCFTCHEAQPRKMGRPVREHVTSAHYRAGVTCQDCHGGDQTKDDHLDAHDEAKGFVGALDKPKMVDRCGKCHDFEVKTFVASKHFPAHDNVNEVNCITCHSAHQIGARDKDFGWPKTCNECHDLDHVPDLPADIAAMMVSKDPIVEQMRLLRHELQDKPFPPEVMEPYREVRQLSGDIVHATRAKGAEADSQKVIAKNKALEAKIAALLPK